MVRSRSPQPGRKRLHLRLFRLTLPFPASPHQNRRSQSSHSLCAVSNRSVVPPIPSSGSILRASRPCPHQSFIRTRSVKWSVRIRSYIQSRVAINPPLIEDCFPQHSFAITFSSPLTEPSHSLRHSLTFHNALFHPLRLRHQIGRASCRERV